MLNTFFCVSFLVIQILIENRINNIISNCRSICIKYLLEGSMPHIMQLQEGLSACNVLSSARENPALWKTVFVPGFTISISPEEFLDQLIVQFSVAELCKEAEIDAYKYFCDFIVGSEYHGSGGKLFNAVNSIFFSVLLYHDYIRLQLTSLLCHKNIQVSLAQSCTYYTSLKQPKNNNIK